MTIAEVAVRAVIYLAAMLLFGASVFVLYSPRPTLGDVEQDDGHEWRALRSHAWRLQLACVVATVVAGLLWLVIHAAAVVGVPIAQAISWGAAGKVVSETLFGRTMALHLGLAVVLAGTMLTRPAVVHAHSPIRGDTIRAALSAAVLASLAWMGHAAATPGIDGYAHLGADVAHLLAAGAWLGALPLLALILIHAGQRQSPGADRIAVRTTQRFSRVAVVCVGALVLTGAVNAWYLVATPAALFGTTYGQLLFLKLALFALMLVLAARNRFILTPRIREADRGSADVGRVAMRHIARNAWIEAALGVAVVVIVGALGISVPGAHAEISWPLPFALDPGALDEDPRLDHAFSELILIALLAAGFALYGFRRGHTTAASVAALAGAAALASLGYLFAVPAHPTTYARSPIRYTTAAIAAGATLYHSNCRACHGAEGKGDGPAAAALPIRPADLASGHGAHHLPGDLYWWIAHGISGTPMPSFEGQLTPRQIWQLVAFLHANAEAQEARRLNSRVGDWRPIVAPDFPFEIARGEQETLEEQRDRHAVLLVLYGYPESRMHLIMLAEARKILDQAGIRILAIPFDAQTTTATQEGIDRAILATSDPSVAAAYSLFLPTLPTAQDGSRTQYAEILIDRSGYVRSIRMGLGDVSANPVAELVQEAGRLAREPPHPPPSGLHMH